MIYTRGAAQTRVQTADQMANVYSLKIGRNQMYYSLENFDFFAHSLELPLKTGVLTPRQSQPRSCFLYSLQM